MRAIALGCVIDVDQASKIIIFKHFVSWQKERIVQCVAIIWLQLKKMNSQEVHGLCMNAVRAGFERKFLNPNNFI
jgi:hypothetical protein